MHVCVSKDVLCVNNSISSDTNFIGSYNIEDSFPPQDRVKQT